MSKEDEQTPGIGHNQGPAIDQEPVAESDKLNLVSAVKSSGGDQHHEIAADDYSADSTAAVEQPKSIEGCEAKWAAGYAKVAGKTIAADGLVSKGGYRRIVPEGSDREWIERNTQTLREIAAQVLHGRNATIFEKMVIGPVENDVRRPPVEQVAAQFNIKDRHVYKILDTCWDRVRRALPGFRAAGTLLVKGQSPICSICGRHESSEGLCARGNSGVCERDWHSNYSPSITVRRDHLDDPEFAARGARWAEQEAREEAAQAKAWLEHMRVVMERWENTYGVNRPYGPKWKAK